MKEQILEYIQDYWIEKTQPKEFVPGKTVVPVSGAAIDEYDIRHVADALLDGWFTEWIYASKFSKNLSEYVGVAHSVLCNSGSSANLLATLACIEKFSKNKSQYKIVTCATGFPTTVAPILQFGYVPLFVDIDPRKLNPKIDDIILCLDRADVAGVVLAHTLGFPIEDVASIRTICDSLGKFFVEDTCLVAGTKVKTNLGDKNIEDVVRGDLVLTRNGFKKVLESKKTGTKPVIRRLGLVATPNHPVITTKGIKRLDTLNESDTIYIWNEKQLSIMEKPITAIHNQISGNEESIFGGTQNEFHSPFIDRFGLTILEKSQKDFLFTIEMKTHLIMTSLIWNLCPKKTTQVSTLQMSVADSPQIIWQGLPDQKRLNGMEALRGKSFTKELEKWLGKINKLAQKYVKYVAKNIKHIFLEDQKIAHKNAKIEVADVYNLTIQDAHEFFANGILVHNCDALGASHYTWGKLGSYGHCASTSFFPAHQITTGEGGAVLTDDPELAEIVRCYAEWGRDCSCKPGQDNTCGKRFDHTWTNLPTRYDHKYTFTRIGYNLKMTELSAALGFSQLTKLNMFVEIRQNNYEYLYNNLLPLQDKGIFRFVRPSHYASPFGFPITVTNPDYDKHDLVNWLENKKIRTRPVFSGNITRQPMFDHVYYETCGKLDNSDYVMNNTFWVGVSPNVTPSMLEYICECVNSYVQTKNSP